MDKACFVPACYAQVTGRQNPFPHTQSDTAKLPWERWVVSEKNVWNKEWIWWGDIELNCQLVIRVLISTRGGCCKLSLEMAGALILLLITSPFAPPGCEPEETLRRLGPVLKEKRHLCKKKKIK